MEPSRFRGELKRFDKSLDLEFNGPKGRWEVVGTDRRNNKYLIKPIPLGDITATNLQDLLTTLWECSPHKQGGAKELNRRMDALKEEEEERLEKHNEDRLEVAHKDAYISFKYREGERLSFAGIGDSPSNGIVINDRRRVVTEDLVSAEAGGEN